MAERPALARPLTLLMAARLIVNTAVRFTYPFLPAIARGLGISLQQGGVLISARWLAGLTTPLAVGAAGRGERRRRLMIVGLAFFTTGMVVTAATNLLVGAVIGFALTGLGKPLFDIGAQSYVSDRTPYHRRARYLSILELTWAGGLLVGAPLAGLAIQRFGWRSPFWILGGLGALALIATSRIVEDDREVPGGRRARLEMDGQATTFLVVVAMFTAAAELPVVVFGAWLEDGFGLGLLALGGVATVLAVAEALGEGAVLGIADRIGKRRSVALGLGMSAVSFALLAGLDLGLGAGVGVLAMALLGFEFTIVSAIPLATELRPRARSRFLALMAVAAAVSRAAADAVGPWLFERYGFAANAAVAAIVDLAAMGLLLSLVGEAGTPPGRRTTSERPRPAAGPGSPERRDA